MATATPRRFCECIMSSHMGQHVCAWLSFSWCPGTWCWHIFIKLMAVSFRRMWAKCDICMSICWQTGTFALFGFLDENPWLFVCSLPHNINAYNQNAVRMPKRLHSNTRLVKLGMNWLSWMTSIFSTVHFAYRFRILSIKVFAIWVRKTSEECPSKKKSAVIE